MSLSIRKILNNQGDAVNIPCAGQNYVGINVAGSWTGTVLFQGTLNLQQYGTIAPMPWPFGTPSQQIAANATLFFQPGNLLAIQAVLSQLTSVNGPTITLATGQDFGVLDAFLAPSAIYVTQVGAANAANTFTKAADASCSWNLRSLVVTINTTSGAPSGTVQVKDGSTIIFQCDLQSSVAPARMSDGIINIPLPLPSNSVPMGGVVGSPNTAMTITVSNLGQYVASTINAEFHRQ